MKVILNIWGGIQMNEKVQQVTLDILMNNIIYVGGQFGKHQQGPRDAEVSSFYTGIGAVSTLMTSKHSTSTAVNTMIDISTLGVDYVF